MRPFLLLSSLALAWALDITGSVSPQTHIAATVTLRNGDIDYLVPILKSGSFSIPNVVAGSYVLHVDSMVHSFPTLRVDVDEDASVMVYRHAIGTTFNPPGTRVAYPIQLTATGVKEYYMLRSGFNVFGMLKNPMVLLGLAMAFSLFVLPALTKYLDPEGVEEMHKIREAKAKEAAKLPPVDNPVEKLQNFDVSGWLAGKK